MEEITENKKVGAVMIVGGGIGGMQASIDLAESGIKVYLVENKPCIGGVMSQLDKTFPTNDCAMCTMAPRLVEIGRHKDIEIITLADIERIQGKLGNFSITLKRRSRYIIEEKCTGCGECETVCPVEVPNEFNQSFNKRKAIYRLYPQAVPNFFSIDKAEQMSPCRLACPAGCDNQAYIALISQGKFKEAIEVIRRIIPIPSICGRICNATCEDKCNRQEVDEAIAIRALKRFAADYERLSGGYKEIAPPEVKFPEKVAIIGSGPAGLTCAYDLAKCGYRVTIFELLPVVGGMLRVGIPQYRLPSEIIDYEIEQIKKAGVEILTNTPLGPGLTLKDIFAKGYKAIFIAIGMHQSKRLGIEGEDLSGVIHGATFLHGISRGRQVDLEDKVVAVVGGGNVALDSVRTALRLGAKDAFIIYRRSRSEMLVREEEIEEAEKEGIKIYYLTSPSKILGREGKVYAIECTPMKLAEPDETGRRRPVPDETKSKIIIEVDLVIPAIGQEPDFTLLGEDLVRFETTTVSPGTKPIWRVVQLEGSELEGVYGFTAFLQAVSAGKKIEIGRRVIVIGGGNVAIDVARTTLRLGVEKVNLVCLESHQEMPAHHHEIKEAEEEGIIIHTRKGPQRILGKEGRVCGVEFMECISVFDSQGRFSPVFQEQNVTTMDADTVIVAVGQLVDYSLVRAADGVLMTERGFLKVDKTTLATNIPGIFAGGDVVGLSAFAVDAIAHGHEAAESIHRYLRGLDLYEGRQKEAGPGAKIPQRKIEQKNRVQMPKLPPQERIKSFAEVELGYSIEQAVAEANRCLNCGICSECLLCVESCKLDAIDHQMPKESSLDLNVGAIILSPGYELFDANLRKEFGYERYANVVTSLEFERILSASGPYSGKILRPSDGLIPKKIAFIQCFGCRDLEHNYCSSICCMYATKEAIIAKEHLPQIECHILFIDLRAFGKGFEEYYERAKRLGVKYIRCLPSTIKEIPYNKNLKIQYLDEENKIVEEVYDLVVLSTAIVPPKKVKELAGKLGFELNEHGFCQTAPFRPVESTREGIYVCGPFNEPKDIPETVMQASAAAALSLVQLYPARGSLIKPKIYPPEKDVSGQLPRVGVFVCHCGTNIAGVVNVADVVEYAKNLPDVVYAEDNLYTCSNDTQEKIKKLIKEQDLNRVVVASCTPRTHEPLFRNTVREAGLNPYLFEMANIRDQCSWVHMHEKELATEKAKDLVRMAVAKTRLLEPLYRKTVEVIPTALLIGGGLSGMTAALGLAQQGFEVYLVEKEKELGGNLRHLHFLLSQKEPQDELEVIIKQIQGNQRIHLFTDTKIVSVEGSIGNFKTHLISAGDREIEINHGVIIVATGAQEYKPQEYLYGQDERIITQLELEEKLSRNKIQDTKNIVMIQCVGSRDDQRPYCSRICCAEAVKNALKVKEMRPQTNVFVLYRDIRTYGFKESFYRKARERGVIFIRYEKEKKPEVNQSNDGGFEITVFDYLLNMPVTINADLLVLSSAIIAHPENKDLAQMLKIPLTQDNFFLEAHMKLRPVDFATEGIFLCGLAHSPKTVEESITQALSAASRASTILCKKEIELEANISWVVDEYCDGCAYCIDPCPYKAITLIEYMKDGAVKKTVEVNETACKGCGVCQATCPKKGIFVKGFKLEQIGAQVEAALSKG